MVVGVELDEKLKMRYPCRMNNEETREVAVNAVMQAGEVLKRRINEVKRVSQKSSRRDLVSDVDIEVEQILFRAIHSNFPSHSILSEETGWVREKSATHTWVIDPIDGTMNFVHGHPPFRVGLCLLHEDKPVLSVMYGPTRDHLFVAAKGEGSTLNGNQIHVSTNNNLEDSIFMTHLSSKKLPRLRTILSLERVYSHTSHVRMFGSGLASMSYIAEGRYDVFYNIETKVWDILPGYLLRTEAGGQVTDIEGAEITLDSTSVLATNRWVHKQMLELLRDI